MVVKAMSQGVQGSGNEHHAAPRPSAGRLGVLGRVLWVRERVQAGSAAAVAQGMLLGCFVICGFFPEQGQ